MEHLDYPENKVWNQRREWFENLILQNGYKSTTKLTGEQATALLFDLQCCFCAGAWVTVIILCIAVIESNINEITPPTKNSSNLANKLKESGINEKSIDELRRRRNYLVHINKNNYPAITIDDQYDNRQSLEQEARQAIQLVFKIFKKQEGA